MGNDDLVHRKRRAATSSLDRLDDAELAQAVTALGPDGLQVLVSDIGLADAGHWLALATPAQVLQVLDAELWQAPSVGDSERFDPAGFTTWLEALVEVSPALAADHLADAPRELVVLGVFRRALVFDTDELWLAVARGLVDPAIDDQPQLEVDDWLVVGRDLEGWDALCAALTELADRHPEVSAAVLDQCRALTDAAIGEHGLQEALVNEVEGEEEAALEREDRRSRRGYVAPHAARSFLALAVEVSLEAQIAFGGRDPVTAAYFRMWERDEAPLDTGLTLTGLAGARPEELGYLVQVVLAACTLDGRAFRVDEAADAVLAVCRVGEAVGPTGPVDALFRHGYHVLHARVVLPARRAGYRIGLADPIPRLDGRFVGSLAEIALAEAVIARGGPMVEVDAEILRKRDDLPRYVEVPADAAAALGASGTTLVTCSLGDGPERRRTLKPWDDDRWFVEVPGDWCQEAGVEVGDRVTLRMALADAALPEALARALDADPAARDRWHALPAAQQREWSEHVRSAKRSETRARRAAVIVARLR